MNAANATDNPTLSALECIEQLYEGGVGAPLGHDACHVSAYHGAGVKFSGQVGEWWSKSKGSVTTYARKLFATNTRTLNLATLPRTNVIPFLPHSHPSVILVPFPSLSSLPHSDHSSFTSIPPSHHAQPSAQYTQKKVEMDSAGRCDESILQRRFPQPRSCLHKFDWGQRCG